MPKNVYPPGERMTPEYNSWRGMIYRCYGTKEPDKQRVYSYRGIKVCGR